MTFDEPRRPRHQRADDLPPYAPHLPEAAHQPAHAEHDEQSSGSDIDDVATPVVTPATLSEAELAADRDSAEEAAAFAEAQEQGVVMDDSWTPSDDGAPHPPHEADSWRVADAPPVALARADTWTPPPAAAPIDLAEDPATADLPAPTVAANSEPADVDFRPSAVDSRPVDDSSPTLAIPVTAGPSSDSGFAGDQHPADRRGALDPVDFVPLPVAVSTASMGGAGVGLDYPAEDDDAEFLGLGAPEPEAVERRGAARSAARHARQQQAAEKLAAATPGTYRHGGFRVEPVRTVVRGLGQLLITLGMVLLLFVVYEVYITDLFGAQKQAAAKESMELRWAAVTPEPAPVVSSSATAPESDTVVPSTDATPPAEEITDPAQRTKKYTTVIGQGFANIYIPAFGADYSYTIVEGTTTEDLYGNPGHYDDTEYPGELGNFAVAGHRVSKGSPFNALGTLNSCDSIVIETQDDWFIYRVLPMPDEMANWNPASRAECNDVAPLTGEYQDLAGREITVPTDYAQVLPVPHLNAVGAAAVAAATQRIITLTTCHPQFSDRERMIVHGVLTKSYAKAAGFTPPELNES